MELGPHMRTRILLAALVLGMIFSATSGLRTQEPNPPGPPVQGQMPPQPGQPTVGRVSLVHGSVATQRGDSDDWVPATMNAPLVGGDQIATDSGSRAEVQLDYANVVRLN